MLKIGDKEIESQTVTAKRRHSGVEEQLGLEGLSSKIAEVLDTIQTELFEKSKQLNASNTREAKDYEEFKTTVAEHKGFVKVSWNDDPEVEAKIKLETKAVSRCKLAESHDGIDFFTGEPTKDVWLFAQSY